MHLLFKRGIATSIRCMRFAFHKIQWRNFSGVVNTFKIDCVNSSSGFDVPKIFQISRFLTELFKKYKVDVFTVTQCRNRKRRQASANPARCYTYRSSSNRVNFAYLPTFIWNGLFLRPIPSKSHNFEQILKSRGFLCHPSCPGI